MKILLLMSSVALLSLPAAAPAFAQGAADELDVLNDEATELYRMGKYDRAVNVA